jgi:crotonobetainyl-CoA:carnitine CoA-transferase CaiB-like acyl-CoA transferase
MPGPLAGLRIVDLTENVAGPFATKQLADYGADVVKIERPGGDPARRLGPFPGDQPDPERCGLFVSLNTNKRSVVLDPGQPSGREAVLRLVERSDALVESFAPGTLASWRLSYDDLQAVNPRVVLTSVSPFGQRGPASARRETDLTLAARGAWLRTAGEPDREPIAYYGSQVSCLAGLQAAWGTAAALLEAIRSGRGQWVDVSMYEAALMTQDLQILAAEYNGNPGRVRAGRRSTAFPGNLLPVADGFVSLLITDGQWPRFCRMAGLPDYAADPGLATQGGRTARRQELEAAFMPWFLSRSKHEVFAVAQANGVPIAPYEDIAELLDDPQFAVRGIFPTVVHPILGPVRMNGAPLRLAGTPWSIRRPAPLLDQHASEILIGELGYSREDLLTLRAAGVTG